MRIIGLLKCNCSKACLIFSGLVEATEKGEQFLIAGFNFLSGLWNKSIFILIWIHSWGQKNMMIKILQLGGHAWTLGSLTVSTILPAWHWFLWFGKKFTDFSWEHAHAELSDSWSYMTNSCLLQSWDHIAWCKQNIGNDLGNKQVPLPQV